MEEHVGELERMLEEHLDPTLDDTVKSSIENNHREKKRQVSALPAPCRHTTVLEPHVPFLCTAPPFARKSHVAGVA